MALPLLGSQPHSLHYPEADRLYKKTNVVDLFFTHHLGAHNPFGVLTTMVTLCLDLQLLTATYAQEKSSLVRYEQSKQLFALTKLCDDKISYLLAQLSNEQPYDEAIKQLSLATQQARKYIEMHVADLVANTDTYKREEKHPQRFIEVATLLAVTPLVKVIAATIIGGITLFFAVKKIKETLQSKATKVDKQITNIRKDLKNAHTKLLQGVTIKRNKHRNCFRRVGAWLTCRRIALQAPGSEAEMLQTFCDKFTLEQN
mgnify:CR=1 FL=1